MSDNTPIRRALISVSDKAGILELGQGLAQHGVELLSTGGTAKMLREAGLAVIEVAEHTGFPEMLDGRVKTLHPKIHGGLLGRRDLPEHVAAMEEHGIPPIDLVCVNLYPFKEVTSRGCTFEEAIENIDIGGPSMLRSAAKNHSAVTVLTDPADYAVVLEEMKANGGATTLATRARLAKQVFRATAAYDGMIADYLGGQDKTEEAPFGETMHLALPLESHLRYGENPHQKAALFGRFTEILEQLHGKELSFNNIVDIDSALRLMMEFSSDPRAVVAILKHNTPCGVGAGDSPRDAYQKAFETDPESPFGGILVSNRTWDLPLAEAVDEIFTEVLIAPDFTPEALALLQKKKNRRLMRWHQDQMPTEELDIRGVAGGFLVQDRDTNLEDPAASKVASKRAPSSDELAAMTFGWRVVKHVKSNAVVLAGPDRTLGVGGGQTSRVDSVRIAIDKAKRRELNLQGSALASDAFFPFPDGVELALDAGATAIVQPGGSVKDDDAVAAADAKDATMVMTGARHFRH
ncbi:MAG: bifunctional phosphoribosylaminoimidazolecarboxamide formyltransferase/IMP cyclohydrolase [Candidatus Binatia bacterium]|nr:bifunctional phosphoribosylaminoimidazolecarboxamide formyltransferase/IMP cyclohydrolase [Candidatus Binatia bacterium]